MFCDLVSNLKIRAGAVIHVVPVPLKVQHRLAVVAAVVLELVEGLDEGADQARPQLLHALWHYVHRHFEVYIVITNLKKL